MNPLSAAIVLIVLHSVDGFEMFVNPEEIVVMRPSNEAATGRPNQIIVTGPRCIIGLSSGRFISVIETCTAVREMVEKSDTLK